MIKFLISAFFLISSSVYANAQSRIDLTDDIETGWGNLWLKSMENGFKSYGYKVITDHDGINPRFGKQFIRFEVQPGDCGSNRGWDDCTTGRERHELSQTKAFQKHGDEFWYAWSIFVPKDVPFGFPAQVTMAQFHQRKNNVLWLFQWKQGGYVLSNQVPGNEVEKETGVIIPTEEFQGKWHDILVHGKWSHNSNGFFRVYTNHALRYDYSGQTIAKGDQSFFKFGLYRSAVERYHLQKKTDKLPAQTVYFDEVHRNKSLAKVDRVGVAKIQSLLAENGYYKGAIDGLWGNGSRGAINKFFEARGQAPVKAYSPTIWMMMADDPNVAVQTSQPVYTGKIGDLLAELQGKDKEMIQQWQSYLRHVGEYKGSVDGNSNIDLLKAVISCKAKNICEL